MRQILVLNDLPKQQFRVSIENYDFLQVTIEYASNQYAWYMSLLWGQNFEVKNDRVVCSPNLLRQYKDLIPFGILVRGPDSVDPFSITAWQDGWEMHFLDSDDIEYIEAEFYD